MFVPVIPTLTPIGAFPVLLNVTACGALLVPTTWAPKVRLVGDTFAMGAGAGAPVPVKLTLCGLPAALSVMLTAAVRGSEPLGRPGRVTGLEPSTGRESLVPWQLPRNPKW